MMPRDSVTPATQTWGSILALSAIIALGRLLGMAWLEQPVLGLPAGLWMIVIALVAPGVGARLATILRYRGATREPAGGSSPGALAIGWWPREAMPSEALGLALRALSLVVTGLTVRVWGTGNRPRAHIECRLDRSPWATRPLRVGLQMPAARARAIVESEGLSSTVFLRIDRWDDPRTLCARHGLDALLVCDAHDAACVVTPEHEDARASMAAWTGRGEPLALVSLFPSGVDPASVIVELDAAKRFGDHAPGLRALAEAVAALARSGRRLNLADRIAGRRPCELPGRAGDGPGWRQAPSLDERAMARLAGVVSDHSTPERLRRVAAQGVGAWCVARSGLSPEDRAAMLAQVAGALSEDPVARLRLGAARIGAMDDHAGLADLIAADAMVRRLGLAPERLDHAAFLESELRHGTDEPISLGRAAAGIALVCALTPEDRLPFLRDDMLDEMAYAGWLVGRDQDRLLLIRLFRELERARGTLTQRSAA